MKQDEIISLSKSFNVPPAYLMGEEEEPKAEHKKVEAMLRLKALREASKKTMAQVARDLGISYTTYVNYEKGEREPNFQTLMILAGYFNCSIDHLFACGNQENSHEAVLKTAENVLKEYLSEALVEMIIEKISDELNKKTNERQVITNGKRT